jgi:DinB family protein
MTLLEALTADLKRMHATYDKAIDGITAEQLHAVPAGHAKANTIAWNIWHYVRTEDNVVRFVLQNRRPTVWGEGGYPEKLGLHPAAQGTGMSAEEAQALRIKDIPLFARYMKEVWASSGEYVASLKEADLDRVIAMKFVGDMPLARVLGMVAITHGYTHLGEIDLARTLVGAKPVTSG